MQRLLHETATPLLGSLAVQQLHSKHYVRDSGLFPIRSFLRVHVCLLFHLHFVLQLYRPSSKVAPFSDTETMSDMSDMNIVPRYPAYSAQLSEPKRFDSSNVTAPVATSTPMRSAQMPSEIQLQSSELFQFLSGHIAIDPTHGIDLLDQDSEMHRVMNGTDSFEGNSTGKKCETFPHVHVGTYSLLHSLFPPRPAFQR